ncbi:MAG: hypothetical protein HDR28_05520 [Lachnospiraceae bacterium]|nr:hypothetical protein [Lachnospiraceae bacterium]
MDIIQNAIEKKQHISNRKELNTQTWQDFRIAAQYKKVFLFGISACADYFFENYHDIRLEGIIDNDVRKQGFYADDFLCGAVDNQYGHLKISSIEVLNSYKRDNVIILVTSSNYYEQIIAQLEEMGIKECFVLLIIEAHKRSTENGYPKVMDSLQIRKDYANLCCQKEMNSKKIVFYSFGTYSDHGKYITEALLKSRDDLDIVWLLSDLHTEVPKGVRKIRAGNWKRYIYEVETAKMWIYNMIVPDYIIKRPGQIYIQTKHWASITLKKFYLDSATIQDVPEKVNNWKYNSKMIDYIITGSDFDTESCRKGFDFHKEVWQIGSPRSDALFREKECKEKVYGLYKIKEDKHLLLYAPTYRFDKSRTGYQHESREIDLDFKLVKNVLEKHFGGEWCILLRLHPSVAKESAKLINDDFVIDAGDYEDSEELVAACDILISDYSSILFEPAFVQKPVFLLAMDREEYIDKEYDLLIDYDSLPFPIAESNEELVQKIEQFHQDEYEQCLSDFMKGYGVKEDGHASERAAGLISEQIKGV